MKAPLKRKNKEPQYDLRAIQQRVAEEVSKTPETLEELEGFLARWWCRHYHKPYKCREVHEYTLEELLYEYFDIRFRENPDELKKFMGELPDEEQAKEEDEAWLQQMMGEGYVKQEDQEKELRPIKADLEEAIKDKKEEEFSFNFDEFK